MFNKLKEHLKAMLEGNRCRFSRECEHYRLDSTCCNDWLTRFPNDDGSYCGKYREFDKYYPLHPKDAGGYIVPTTWSEAVKKNLTVGKISKDSITIAGKGENNG